MLPSPDEAPWKQRRGFWDLVASGQGLLLGSWALVSAAETSVGLTGSVFREKAPRPLQGAASSPELCRWVRVPLARALLVVRMSAWVTFPRPETCLPLGSGPAGQV